MASTFSSALNLELQASGENSGTWGVITNNNLQKVESAIKGYVSIAGNFIDYTAVDQDTAPTAVATGDKVKFLFVKNTSTTDGIMLSIDAGTAAFNLADGIFVGPSQSWFGRLPNVTVADLHAISADIGDAGDASATVIVAALLDDVG